MLHTEKPETAQAETTARNSGNNVHASRSDGKNGGTQRPAINKQLLEKRYVQGDEKTWLDVVTRVANHAGHETNRTEEFIDLISEGKFFPSRMTYMGTDYPFASSCFVFPVEDSLTGIMQTLSDACQVQKYGGGCIGGESIVLTDHGPMPIQELVQRRDPDIRVLSYDPDTHRTEYRRVGEWHTTALPGERIYEISFDNMRGGVEARLRASDWHPFFVFDGEKVIEVRADELEPGMAVIGPTSFAAELDPWNWALGYITGDGAVSKNRLDKYARVRIYDSNRAGIRRAADVPSRLAVGRGSCELSQDERYESNVWVCQVYGDTAEKIRAEFTGDVNVLDSPEPNGAASGAVSAATATATLAPDSAVTAYTKRVPKSVWQSDASGRFSYLVGYLDADGWFDKEKQRFEVSTVSEKLAYDVVALAGTLGIRTKIRRRESRRPNEQESWVVAFERSASIAQAVCAISAKYSDRDIGWVCGSIHLSSAWRDRLREAGIDTYHADAWREATDVDGSDVSLAYWLQHGKATRETAHAILSACGKPELANAVRSCQIVREVRRTDEPETLYDLTVPGTQTYVASDPTTGSFVVVHNTGYNFSHLRPKGDLISTSGGDASGPVSFMGLFHNAMEVVHRAGKKHAAQMGILNCDHPDIMEFIQCKDQEGAYWTFNISVAVTDEFMQAVRNDDDWELKFNGKVYKTIKAKDLWDYIVQHAWHNGDPGVIFIDTVNRNNRYPEPIEACNPCVAEGTLVNTPFGYRPVEDIRVGDLVSTMLGSEPVKEIEVHENYPIFKVEFSDGGTQYVTAAHRYHVIKPGDKRIHRIPLRECKAGDYVKVEPAPLSNEGTEDDYLYGLRQGVLLGDGCYTEGLLHGYGKQNNVVMVATDYREAKYNENVVELFDTQHPIHRNKGSNSANIAILHGRELIVELNLDPSRSHTKKIDVLEVNTFNHALGLLDGLLATDGNISLNKYNPMIRWRSVSADLVIGIRQALLLLGCHARVYEVKTHKSEIDGRVLEHRNKLFDVCLLGENAMRYAELSRVGELHPGKGASIKKLITDFNLTGDTRKARIVSIEEAGTATVYDLYCEESDTWITEGYVQQGCGEQMLPPYVSCNLGSIDLSRFADDGQIDWDGLEAATRSAIRFLDGSVASAFWPVDKIRERTRKYRNIGLGVMGWADMLILLGIPYDSDEAVALAEKVMGFIDDTADDESRQLGGGQRKNTTVTSIAPTGSISLLAGCSSGIEPIFGIVMIKNTYVGSYHNVHWIFKKMAQERGFYDEEILDEIARTGSVQHIEAVPDDVKRLFKTAMEVDWQWHVKHQAAFQQHTDNAVSKTINLPNEATVADVEDAYLMAYETGCKSITVYRDGSRQVQVMDNKTKKRNMCPNCNAILFMKDGQPTCVTCGYKPSESEADTATTEELGDKMLVKAARPPVLIGKTYRKNTPLGTAYVTINSNGMGEHDPFEVFLNVGKAGSEVSAVSEAMGRIMSLVLRIPSPVDRQKRLAWIADELVDIGGGRPMGFGSSRVRSLPDGVAQVLVRHLDQSPASDPQNGQPASDPTPFAIGDICPDCGEAALLYEEGCRKCHFCGYSEC